MDLDKVYEYSCLEEIVLKNIHKHIQFIRHDFICTIPVDLITSTMLEGICRTEYATYLIINTQCTILIVVAPKWLIKQNEDFTNNVSRELNNIIKRNGRS